jgi:hypothetical protein
MPLHGPERRRERVLIYGRPGSGKSSAWTDLALWRERTKASWRIHLADTDHAWEAMDPDGRFDDFLTVKDLSVNDFHTWPKWAKDTAAVVARDDWLVVDMIDKAWEGAQNFYWDQVGDGASLADIFLRNQTDDKFHMAGDHGANWGVINKYYASFYQTIVNANCNVMCIAPAKEVGDSEKAAVKAQYKVGWKAQGQKDLLHGFHTVLFAAEAGEGKWVYTTVKERNPPGQEGRKMLKGEKVNGFVTTYLVGVAGWRMA